MKAFTIFWTFYCLTSKSKHHHHLCMILERGQFVAMLILLNSQCPILNVIHSEYHTLSTESHYSQIKSGTVEKTRQVNKVHFTRKGHPPISTVKSHSVVYPIFIVVIKLFHHLINFRRLAGAVLNW